MTSSKLKEILIKADKQVRRDKFSQKKPATIENQTARDTNTDNMHPLFKKLLSNMTKIIEDTMQEYQKNKVE